MGYWRGYLSGARFRLAYGQADATATHCLFSSLASVKFRLVLPFWYRLIRVIPEKEPCVCVCEELWRIFIKFGVCVLIQETVEAPKTKAELSFKFWTDLVCLGFVAAFRYWLNLCPYSVNFLTGTTHGSQRRTSLISVFLETSTESMSFSMLCLLSS